MKTVSESAIAALAYQLWQQRGCPIGSDQQDWFRAEEDLKKLAKGSNGGIADGGAGVKDPKCRHGKHERN